MKRVLIIDDNENNLYLIKYLLERHGFEVIEASNGIDGVALAIRENPESIIMDIPLPDLDGLETAERIRDSDADGHPPSLARTSFSWPGSPSEIAEA